MYQAKQAGKQIVPLDDLYAVVVFAKACSSNCICV